MLEMHFSAEAKSHPIINSVFVSLQVQGGVATLWRAVDVPRDSYHVYHDASYGQGWYVTI
jgi:hypothetical protein